MLPKALQTVWLTTGATFAAASLLAAPTQAQQSTGQARVLVADLAVEHGVKGDFGRRVAGEVRGRLQDVPAFAPVDRDAVEEELDRLDLDPEKLERLHWRQLAGRMNVDLLVQGTIVRTSAGLVFRTAFVDVRTGDEAAVPEFVVPDDGRREAREAADRIMAALREHMEHLRTVLICSDYLADERYEDAARNCEKAFATSPNSTTVRYLMGRVEMGRANFEAAREHLGVVVEANPAHLDALQSLAYTETQLGNFDRAREFYREYLEFNPDDAAVRMRIAYEMARAGDFEGAVVMLREGLARDATNDDMWQFLGDVLLKQATRSDTMQAPDVVAADVQDRDALRDAIEAYEKVLELRGAETDPQILRNVVAAYLHLDDTAAAARFAERAEDQFPGDASLRALRADILARQGDYAGAVRAMDEALQLDTDLPRGLARRGFFRLRAGDEAGALADFRAAVAAGEDADLIAQQLLGRGHSSHFESGRYDRAAEIFEAGLEFAEAPGTREQLQFFLAFSHYQAGAKIDEANQAEEACEPARRALERFRKVLPHLEQAGDFQPRSQAQLRENTDLHLYRQGAILEKPACR